MADRYIGLMSGTSLDGIDGVLVEFTAEGSLPLRVLAHVYESFDPPLRQELLALNAPGEDELHRAALAGNALVRHCATVVARLLANARDGSGQVRAIAAHGQTVRHRPGEFDGTGYSIQLNSPALLAEITGIDVICDFRSRDVAAGGQGAPLVPAFHQSAFGGLAETLAVLNIGGISNLTVMHRGRVTLAFDCGPGNALMDHWCRLHTGAEYDDRGGWAARGTVSDPLLGAFLRDPYFLLPPPKSTGRDRFNASWLQAHLAHAGTSVAPPDVQATLAELTAAACANAIRAFAGDPRLLLICGGGAFNAHLLARIAARLPALAMHRTDEFGLPATQVEACAFAWLARAFTEGRAGNVPQATGALGDRILGARYRAR